MEIKTERKKDKLTFSFAGELDECASSYARDVLDGEIENFPAGDVIFDFKNLTFMDSTGIGVILGRYKRLAMKNASVFIKNPQPAVDKILNTGGLYRIIKRI